VERGWDLVGVKRWIKFTYLRVQDTHHEQKKQELNLDVVTVCMARLNGRDVDAQLMDACV
jgi:hypothetical protein